MIAGVTALLMLGIALAQTSEEASIRQAEKDWNAAIGKQDMAAVTKFMADDYVLVNVLEKGPASLNGPNGFGFSPPCGSSLPRRK